MNSPRKWILVALILITGPVRAGSERTFQLNGKVVQSNGKPFHNPPPVVFLEGIQTPFAASAVADAAGEFKFKNLRPGTYSLNIIVPFVGEQRRTIEIGPSFADSKGRITSVYSFEGKHQPASNTVSVSALRIPESAKTEYAKARECLARHDTAGAIARLKKAVEIAPQFSAALNNLGTIAYQSGSFEEAERYFRQALEQEPDAYAPLVNLGGALISEGKLQESLDYNLRAVEARPDDALAHSQLGQSYFSLGQPDAAEVELKRAKALDAGHFSLPQLVLAEIYLRKRNPGAAIKEMEEFLKLHPDSDRVPIIRKQLQDLKKMVPATVPIYSG
jgi:tetratricopeptide (TPR) repeat protein